MSSAAILSFLRKFCIIQNLMYLYTSSEKLKGFGHGLKLGCKIVIASFSFRPLIVSVGNLSNQAEKYTC